MTPAGSAMRDQVAALLREVAPEQLSTEALAARARCLIAEIHPHLRALERQARARRTYSADFLSVYWRWTGPADLVVDGLEAAWVGA